MWVLAACAVSACSRQEAGWQDASRENSVAAYEHYLERFPAGTHAAEARARVVSLHEEAAWMRANRLKTPEAWQRYLGEWPEGGTPRSRDGNSSHSFLRVQRRFAAVSPVQLGAYSNQAATQANLTRFAREHAAELAGLQLLIVPPHDPATISGDCGRARSRKPGA
jgi:hypothetical protein